MVKPAYMDDIVSGRRLVDLMNFEHWRLQRGG